MKNYRNLLKFAAIVSIFTLFVFATVGYALGLKNQCLTENSGILLFVGLVMLLAVIVILVFLYILDNDNYWRSVEEMEKAKNDYFVADKKLKIITDTYKERLLELDKKYVKKFLCN